MARGINKVILVGHLGADPEVRYTQSGSPIVSLNIATTENWKDKQTGENKERTEWHRVVVFNRLAEIAAEYLRKGTLVYIEGQLQTRKWQDQNGQDRYTTEVVINIGGSLQILSSRNGGANEMDTTNNAGWGQPTAPVASQPVMSKPASAAPSAPMSNEPPMDFDDDIPF